jgi:ABC-2 type transport system ATP-binding protein
VIEAKWRDAAREFDGMDIRGRPMVCARDLVKVFRTPKPYGGRFGALRTLTTREYVERRALDGVSFELERGELVGYIGPNGAGKSTTIKILTGILEPTSGEAEVAGLVPWRQREANARRIGVVFGQRSQLWWDLPLVESFELVRGCTPSKTTATAGTWTASAPCSGSTSSSARPSGRSVSANGCEAS